MTPEEWLRGLDKGEVAEGDRPRIKSPLYTMPYMRSWSFHHFLNGEGSYSDMPIFLSGRMFFWPSQTPTLPRLWIAVSLIRVKNFEPLGQNREQKIVAMGITLLNNVEPHALPISRFILLDRNCNFLDKSKFEFGRTQWLPEQVMKKYIPSLVQSDGTTRADLVGWQAADERLDELCQKVNTDPTTTVGGEFWYLVQKNRPTNIEPTVLRNMPFDKVLQEIGIPHRVISSGTSGFMEVQGLLSNVINKTGSLSWQGPVQIVDKSFLDVSCTLGQAESRLERLRDRESREGGEKDWK